MWLTEDKVEILKIKNLWVQFSSTGLLFAVKDVSLNIVNNKKTVMIGESGSGKSVLLLAILRLLPATAHCEGEIIFKGENLLTKSEKEINKLRGLEIGYIPQAGGNALNPLLTNAFQATEGLIEHSKFTKKQAFSKSLQLFEKLHLPDVKRVAKAYPHTLSGGMRQRVLIAMGTCCEADLLLADEPTKGLDETCVKDVVKAFKQLTSQTLICVTHDLNFAKQIADFICVMYSSNMLESCSSDEFFEKQLHPYSQALVQSQPENGLICDSIFAKARENIEQNACPYLHNCKKVFEKCNNMPPLFSVGSRKVRCWLYEN